MSSIHLTVRHLPGCETSQRPAQNILIAVMGVTGSDKSHFIREVSGLPTVVVEGSLGSCTSEVIEYAFEYAGTTITLLDTLGFNDAMLSDTDVLTKITRWTQKRYSDDQLLSGIIYLHRITDVQMEGPSLRNLYLFDKLVGQDCLHKVLLTTIHWSEIAIEEGEAREMELKRTPQYWGNMVECGATVARYTGCRESGLELIDKLIGGRPKALNTQAALAVPGTKSINTETAITINKLLEIQAKLSKDLEETKETHRRAMEQQRDMFKKMLEAERQMMQEQLAKIAKDCKEMLARHNADLIRWEEQTADVLAAIEQKLEVERKAREEAQRKVREEAERRAREEAERRSSEKAERDKLMEMMEAERRAREEAERRAREEAERKTREEAERRARDEAISRARGAIGGEKLYNASHDNNEVLVRLLLEKNVSVYWRDNGGNTALHRASLCNNEVIVRLLLESGVDVNVKGTNNSTALHIASHRGYEAIIQLLLENGADINVKNALDHTALMYASASGHLAVVQLLLERGADVNAKDTNGRTALSFASGNGHSTVVQLLLKKGADVNTKNRNGETALIFASGNNHSTVMQLLRKAGAI